jgi:hypothetical protein
MNEMDLSKLPKDTFVCIEQVGRCKVCGEESDLRYGSCFNCSVFVRSNGKVAWDVRNPINKWNIQHN